MISNDTVISAPEIRSSVVSKRFEGLNSMDVNQLIKGEDYKSLKKSYIWNI